MNDKRKVSLSATRSGKSNPTRKKMREREEREREREREKEKEAHLLP
jgi:hypothetical protein